MAAIPPIKEQIVLSNLQSGRRHDIFYRVGIVIQVLGMALLAVLYPLENPFYTVGIMLFEMGVLLSAAYFLFVLSWVKKVVFVSLLAGMTLQLAGFFIPEQYTGSAIIGGIGIVCTVAAGMAGKEASCLRCHNGWLLILSGFPLIVLANLLGKENRLVNSIGFSALFLALLFLTGRKIRQPLS